MGAELLFTIGVIGLGILSTVMVSIAVFTFQPSEAEVAAGEPTPTIFPHAYNHIRPLHVRLFTRNGHDWTQRYPLVVEAALRHRNSSFVIDGEAVPLGVDGRSDFNGLHSRKHASEVEFYAFNMMVSDGEDIRKLPLSMRKANLAQLLARRINGIHLAPFEEGEIGPDLCRHACLMGLEGLVSKHRESPYRSGRFDRWVKVKNRQHPAFSRVLDQL